MKKFYVHLPSLTGIFMMDCSHANWGDLKKKELQERDIQEATRKGLEIFEKHRKVELGYVDHRFNKKEKNKLRKSFPKEIEIIEEITHRIRV